MKRSSGMQPLAPRRVKSKGEFNKSRNHEAMEEVTRHRVRHMGRENHRVMNRELWRSEVRKKGVQLQKEIFKEILVKRNNCCKKEEDISRKQIKGENVGS